jgi:GNAT superfamily N-acetyltransferase
VAPPWRRIGREPILVPGGSELTPPTKPQPDGVLVKALARAWRWQKLLDRGVYGSVTEIAEAERISKSYVSRILRLALLAPDIVKAILGGWADQRMMLERLERPLPTGWEAQRRCWSRYDAAQPEIDLASAEVQPPRLWPGLEGPSVGLELRCGTSGDVDACASICRAAFAAIAERHAFPPDFPSLEPAVQLIASLLARDDIYSVVAEIDGRVVGSNFLWETASVVGVRPITVDPAVQDQAVGRRLMEDVLRWARDQGFAGVRLVQAGYHNRSLALYAKLGFEAREPLATMQGPALGLTIPGHAVRLATAADAPACDGLHLQLHGFARSRDLRVALEQGTATVVERNGRITVYATGIGFFGHAVAESAPDLEALIGAAPTFPGPGFLLPTRHAELFRWCLGHGLRVVQPMTLMSLGLYREPSGSFLPSVLY